MKQWKSHYLQVCHHYPEEMYLGPCWQLAQGLPEGSPAALTYKHSFLACNREISACLVTADYYHYSNHERTQNSIAPSLRGRLYFSNQSLVWSPALELQTSKLVLHSFFAFSYVTQWLFLILSTLSLSTSTRQSQVKLVFAVEEWQPQGTGSRTHCTDSWRTSPNTLELQTHTSIIPPWCVQGLISLFSVVPVSWALTFCMRLKNF